MKFECMYCGALFSCQFHLKRGWNNAYFCQKICEELAIKELHASMPGYGGKCSKLPDAAPIPTKDIITLNGVRYARID